MVVDYCANPKCLKPLHYLREGTIFIFEVVAAETEPGSRSTHQLEHYWLCGECSMVHRLERTPTARCASFRSSRELRPAPSRGHRKPACGQDGLTGEMAHAHS